MNLVAFIGMPGPLELLILGVPCLGVIVVVVVVVMYAMTQSKKTGENSSQNPNLVPCSDCGRLVSRLAANCPQCGRPLTPQSDQ